MEHSKGKVVVDDTNKEMVAQLDKNGAYLYMFDCQTRHLKTWEEECANAERIAALWNAAEDITTEEAVKILEWASKINNHDNVIDALMAMVDLQDMIDRTEVKISTKESIKYIMHGREMEEELDLILDMLEVDDIYPNTRKAISSLLAKLDKEA